VHFCLFACFCFLPSFFACWIVGLLVCLLFLKMISLTHAIRFGFSLNNLESVVSTDWWLGLCGPLRNAAGKWKCLLLLLDKYNIPGVNWRCLIFSSPEHKMLMVSYCDRPLSVVVRHAMCGMRQRWYLNIFSSETAHSILTKLHRNDSYVFLYQSCSNRFSWLHK